MQLKPKVAPSVKLSTKLLYATGGLIIVTIIGVILFIQLNLGNSTTSLGAGQVYTSRVSGNWSTKGVWQGNVSPGSSIAGVTVTILSGNSVFHNGDISADNNVTINIASNATLTISGDLTVRNNLTLNNSGKLIITKNFIANNNAVATVNGGGVMDVGNNIQMGNNTEFVVNGTLRAGGNVSFGNNEIFNGSGNVNIVGSGCNQWTGSNPCIPGIIVLPVKLLHFDAQDNGEGAVKISWSTAIEKNNDHFIVQRSTDGITYNDIATVQGNGTTQEVSHYDLVDNAPDAERLYYRLTQTDYDGTTEIFSPVFVQVVLKSAAISAYPNPMTGRNLTLNLPEGKPGMIQFLDNRGMTILNKKFDGSGTVMELEFNNDLLPGIYFVNYKPERGDIQNLKIMKK